jgi:hypothetical protein
MVAQRRSVQSGRAGVESVATPAAGDPVCPQRSPCPARLPRLTAMRNRCRTSRGDRATAEGRLARDPNIIAGVEPAILGSCGQNASLSPIATSRVWPNPLTTPGLGSSVKKRGDAEGRHRPGASWSWCWRRLAPGGVWPGATGERVVSLGKASCKRRPALIGGRHHLVGAGGLGLAITERMKRLRMYLRRLRLNKLVLSWRARLSRTPLRPTAAI